MFNGVYVPILSLDILSATRSLLGDTWYVGRSFYVMRFSNKWRNFLGFSAPMKCFVVVIQ